MLPLAYSVRNLARRRLRTALTIGGIALVTVLIVVLVAFSRGVTNSTVNAARKNYVMVLSIGAENDPVRSAIDRGQSDDVAKSLPGVYEDAVGRYASIEAQAMTTVKLSSDDLDDNRVGMIRGVTPSAYLVHDRVFVTAGHEPRGDYQLMVGKLAGARLGLSESALALGNRLFIEGVEWSIVGHFVAPQTPLEAELWVNLGDLMVASRRSDVTLVAAKLVSPEAFHDVQRFCMRRLDLEVIAQTEEDWFKSLLELMQPIAWMAQLLALLVLVGGVVGCANTLYANALARVREMAALQTIGYRRRELAAGLLLEGLLVTGMAGLIGVAVAVAVGDVPIRMPMGAFLFRASVDDALIGMAAALSIGIIGACFPAWRVLRMPLTKALTA